jgi:hypothetical protein
MYTPPTYPFPVKEEDAKTPSEKQARKIILLTLDTLKRLHNIDLKPEHFNYKLIAKQIENGEPIDVTKNKT